MRLNVRMRRHGCKQRICGPSVVEGFCFVRGVTMCSIGGEVDKVMEG